MADPNANRIGGYMLRGSYTVKNDKQCFFLASSILK